MLEIVVVEDEPFARDELKFLLNESQKVKIVGEAESMHEALWQVNQLQPDVVFLDIELAKGTGIELAKQFRHMKKMPMIVFATAYSKYALDAFDLDAVDYLVKPIDETRLSKTLDKLIKHADAYSEEPKQESHIQESKTISAKDEDRMIILQVDEICYIGTENRQTYIKTVNGRYETDTLLYKIMEKLGPKFVQVHRGYIANIEQIDAVEPWFNRTFLLIMKDGSKVPVSRSNAKKIKQILDF
ncbi:LytTR family DNA-binding domain-containing protein [Aciduricibacillus chroicocephali]|uniref:LytTR family DNA-binding domain-containing protein n=1 Tax=Aciduricibacillus chroicocephali TaxID=3054939 RepID=A0ABY9KWS6_9BACI|nr:LytTR family DNA-binding domain-containing protein [Bacillaceae bacterium 44XB]